MIRTTTLTIFVCLFFFRNQVLSQTIIKANINSTHLTSKPDHVSRWLIQNEDSLYNEFIIKANAALNASGPQVMGNYPVSMAVENDESTYMGRFTEEVTKDCDSLHVFFEYTRTSNLSQISLTALLNKKYATALDTILNFVPNLKHFKIQKYALPDTTADSLADLVPGINIFVKDLRVKMTPFDSLQNIIVYIHGNSINQITDPIYTELIETLFGEEIFLKKINTLQFKFCRSIKRGLPTIYEARMKLGKNL